MPLVELIRFPTQVVLIYEENTKQSARRTTQLRSLRGLLPNLRDTAAHKKKSNSWCYDLKASPPHESHQHHTYYTKQHLFIPQPECDLTFEWIIE